MYQATTATRKLSQLRKRIRAVQGGTSAGKTISIEQLLIDDAQSDTTPTLTSIVSESFPHLKRGAIRDFKNIMMDHKYWVDGRWNATDAIYTYESGSKIEFFSADQPAKVRGPRRDRLFLNEGNNVSYETWDQLMTRTKEYGWCDWNPTVEFWMNEKVLDVREDVDHIILTYLDNEALDPRIVAEIESHKHDAAWWRVYGLGLLGSVEGLIYKNWRAIDKVPFEARLVKRGLDYGYSNDPSGILAVYEHNGGFILDEELYQKGMSNRALSDALASLHDPNTLVVADSSEPKSIDEMRTYGTNIIGANKGQGSVNQGITYIQGQKISYTKRSINLAKEYRSYMWLKDKQTDKFINKAQDFNNHLLDPARYALESYMPVDYSKPVYSGNLTSIWN